LQSPPEADSWAVDLPSQKLWQGEEDGPGKAFSFSVQQIIYVSIPFTSGSKVFLKLLFFAFRPLSGKQKERKIPFAPFASLR
jgi:hypothetical protein